MRARFLATSVVGLAAVVIVAALAGAAVGPNVRVTRDATAGSYTRADGGTDATMQACGTNRRAQNEPTVAVDPRNTSVVVAGSNDYCAAPTNGDVWTGYYRSTDGGVTWSDSLLPGYPTDTSAQGLASPAHGYCGASGDPTQDFDGTGRLFYGFICFNRAQPINGGVFVATYDQDGARYVRTVLVDRGTPSANFAGLFQDKINVSADDASGNVYVAWSRYNGFSANNVVLFSRSTDHGQTFSRPIRLSQGLDEESYVDVASYGGSVYVAFRSYQHQGPTKDAIWLARSTDGGVSFEQPRLVADITPFKSTDFGPNECGDPPFACPDGWHYSRFDSATAVAADATGVHVVWGARTASGQGKIFVRNSPDGASWPTAATTLDSVATGHQWFPDVASADGTLTAVFYDSRGDPGYAPNRPPGNTATGTNSGNVVQTLVARSTNGGVSWTEEPVTSAGSNFGWETFGDRLFGFWGDYIYVSAVPGAVHVAWTDSRDLVPGTDPRETDVDGFDVKQCRTQNPDGTWSADTCPNDGGLDENIYAARVG
jgi:hypothetical protein